MVSKWNTAKKPAHRRLKNNQSEAAHHRSFIIEMDLSKEKKKWRKKKKKWPSPRRSLGISEKWNVEAIRKWRETTKSNKATLARKYDSHYGPINNRRNENIKWLKSKFVTEKNQSENQAREEEEQAKINRSLHEEKSKRKIGGITQRGASIINQHQRRKWREIIINRKRVKKYSHQYERNENEEMKKIEKSKWPMKNRNRKIMSKMAPWK